MRKLLYIPVIHAESDLGSIAPAVDRSSASICGTELWAKHKATVSAFWERVADYLNHIDATNLKIYQDGLPAGGERGRKIVEEGARRGSQNYKIILDLMRREAQIRATEDASLLQQEYQYLSGLAQGSFADREFERHKARLTEERDRFVARTINETLKEGEAGILFIGAYHTVLPHLAPDIVVEHLKEQEKIKAYFGELVHGRQGQKFEQLTEYLAAPITAPER